MPQFAAICSRIEAVTEQPFQLLSVRPVSGGDINSAFCLMGADRKYFLKLNRPALIDMFAAEMAGLQELDQTRTLRVPKPIAVGETTEHAYLVLEYLEFGPAAKASGRLLGQQLALLHSQPQPFFGWHRDNTIGSTPQPNGQWQNWPDFWREQRLEFQLKLAASNGYTGKLQIQGERLAGKMTEFFGQAPQASLLHGDLWGGNWATDNSGQPVIFDPACYYGDREADVAMTELFGGFGIDFYAAYNDTYPLDAAGYRTRKNLYNLYHVLNHLNLFGGGYLRQAENLLAGLLAEVG